MSEPTFKKRKSFAQNDSPQSPKKFKSEKVPNGRPSQGTPFKGKKHNKSPATVVANIKKEVVTPSQGTPFKGKKHNKSPATAVANIKKEGVTPSQKTPKLKMFCGTGNLGTPKHNNVKTEPASGKKEQFRAKKGQKMNKQHAKEKTESSQAAGEEALNRHQRKRKQSVSKRHEAREKQRDLRTKVLAGDEAARRQMQEIVNELEKRTERSKTAEKKYRYFKNLLTGDTSQPWRKTNQEKKNIIIENKNKKGNKQPMQQPKKNQGQQNPVAQKQIQKQNQLSNKSKQKDTLQKPPQTKTDSNASKKQANKIKMQKIVKEEDADEDDSDDEEASDDEEVSDEEGASDEEEEVDNDGVKDESDDDDEEDEVSDEDSDSEVADGEENSGETSDDEASDQNELMISNKLKKTVAGKNNEESEEDDEEEESSEEDSEDDTSNQVAKNNVPKQNVNKKKLQQQKVENKNQIKKQPNIKDILEKDKPGRYVVFVGNLPYTSTKQELREHFKKVGEITDIRIPTSKDSNKPKGFAYVEVTNSDSYQKALSLHNTFVGGRRINVAYTQSGKKKSEVQKQAIKAKNFKLQAMRQKGQLAGSVKADQKRSVRRAKKRQFESKE